MSERFKKNPRVKGNLSLEGVMVTDTTVLTGEKWRKWTKSQFSGQVPKLIPAKPGAAPTKIGESAMGKERRKPAPPAKPPGTRTILVTGSKPPIPEVKPPKIEKKKGKTPLSMTDTAPYPLPDPPPEPEGDEEDEYNPVDEDDLTVLFGVGPVREDALIEAGYKTVGDLRSTTPTKLIEDLREQGSRVSTKDARAIIRSARGFKG